VFLDTQNARWNGDTQTLSLLLSHPAPCCANWPLIAHTELPLNAR